MVVQVLPAWRRSTAGADGGGGRRRGPVACRGGRSPPPACWSWPSSTCPSLTHHAPRRPGARARRAAARGLDRRRGRARRRAARLPRDGAAGRRVRGLPLGLHRRPAPPRPDRQAARHPGPPARSAAPRAMDLLYALDDRFQAGVAETGAVAPVARLLGADTIWLPGDAAFDRFRTPRPEITARAVRGGRARRPRAWGCPCPTGRRRPTRPTSPWSTSSRSPIHASASPCRRSSWCRCRTPRRSSGPRTDVGA